MTSAKPSRPGRATIVRATQMLIGAVFGGVAAMIALNLEDSGVLDFSRLSWSEMFGLVLALMLIIAGLFVTATSFSARATASAMDPERTSSAKPGQTVFYRQQGVVTLLAGVMIGAPVLVPLLAGPLEQPVALALMIALVALFLIQTALNLSVWSRADEMVRQMIAEAGAACFWVLQGGLFLWAAAEKLDLAPALSSWDALVVLMTFYLLVSSVLSVRRGFA